MESHVLSLKTPIFGVNLNYNPRITLNPPITSDKILGPTYVTQLLPNLRKNFQEASTTFLVEKHVDFVKV